MHTCDGKQICRESTKIDIRSGFWNKTFRPENTCKSKQMNDKGGGLSLKTTSSDMGIRLRSTAPNRFVRHGSRARSVRGGCETTVGHDKSTPTTDLRRWLQIYLVRASEVCTTSTILPA